MKYNPDIHKRRYIRLKEYNYSQQGVYFITACIKHRDPILGNIIKGNMILNDVGLMVEKAWDELNDNYKGIKTDKLIIMPNHIHGIIFIVGAGPHATSVCRGRPPCLPRYSKGHPQGGAPTVSSSPNPKTAEI